MEFGAANRGAKEDGAVEGLDCGGLAFSHGFLDDDLPSQHSQYGHGALDIKDAGFFLDNGSPHCGLFADSGIAHAVESHCHFASQIVTSSSSISVQHGETFDPVEEAGIAAPLAERLNPTEEGGLDSLAQHTARLNLIQEHLTLHIEKPNSIEEGNDAGLAQHLETLNRIEEDLAANVTVSETSQAAELKKEEEQGFEQENEEENASGDLSLATFSGLGAGEEDEERIKKGWEGARAWLWSLPRRRNVSFEEVEEWLQKNKHNLSKEIVTMPHSHLFRFLVSQHKLMRKTEQIESLEVLEPPTARFQRSDKWKPVYAWLESLDLGSVVGSKLIDEWLSKNPTVKDELLGKHSRHHLFHYIQKCHANIIKKKKRELLNAAMPKSDEKKKKRKRKRKPKNDLVLIQAEGSSFDRHDASLVGTSSAYIKPPVENVSDYAVELQNIGSLCALKSEAHKKYEILSELQAQLRDQIAQMKEHQLRLQESNALLETALTSPDGFTRAGADWQLDDIEGSIRRRSRDFGRTRSSVDIRAAKRRRKGREKFESMVLSWVYSEVLKGSSYLRPGNSGHLERDSPSASSCKDQGVLEKASLMSTITIGLQQVKLGRCSLVKCLQEREKGIAVGSLKSPFRTVGRGRCCRWKSFLQGWVSLENQFSGCFVHLQRKRFSSWLPHWSAYTSSVAVAAPAGTLDQGVQKVLDVRFHPQNLPQIVCSSNAAPNELLLYNLISGKATELIGHNCQIQAVEYAANGDRVISCGSNLVKVWDSNTGACLHTLGPGPWDENASGHRKKVNAMAVNQALQNIVATSGGHGDGQVLLWNINTGDLICNLNGEFRNRSPYLPCMDVLEFFGPHTLLAGSDSSGGPAVVQIWDIQAPHIVASFPANESYITSLKVDPCGMVIASGAGDGSVALTDLRSRGGILRMPVGAFCEVTSVSFSSCGTYLQASSTSNSTIVWDMRMLAMEQCTTLIESPLPLADICSRKTKSLHYLSHGTPMPTSENAGQMPGVVDEGDQGVNDAKWLHNDSLLVTVSGNGSIAMWDMSLGDPCVRHLTSHSRCVNTVAVSLDDKYICSGGDDQKVVLYENRRENASRGWRLTHPLSQDATIN